MTQKLAVFVTAHPKLIILLSILLMIPCAIGFFATGVNYDILSYLPDDIDSVTSLEILDDNFQFAASSIVILEDMKAKDVAKIKQKIEEIDCVAQVLWTDSILDISVPVDILPDIAKNLFYSKNGNATLFIVQYSTGTSDDITLQAVNSIRSILNEQCFISGISAAVADVKNLVETEALIYIAIAVTVALITLAFSMETLFMPLALFFALACAVVYNMGTNFFMREISFVTQCIAAVLQLGVTMDYSIFLIDRFEEEKIKTPEDKANAMQRAIKTSFVSLFSSSMTTVFGFVALCFMSLTIGLDLGLVMAKGVLFGVFAVLTILPAVLLQFDSILSKFRHKRLLPKFDRISAFTLRHKKVFAIAFIVLIIPSFIAKDQMGIYYNVIKGLPEDTPSLIALDKMKEDFDMASTHFLVLPADTPAKKAEKMMREIEELDGIEDVLALNTLLGSAIDTSVLPEIVNDLCYKDGYSLAMINSAYDAGSFEANVQVDAMRQIIAKYSDGGMSTGEAVLMADLAKTADSDLILTSALSIIAILVLIMFAFKSISIPFILVMAIELAIFINQSITWIMGTEVSFIAPIVISCVQLGATVDYAILVTSRYKEYLASGLSNDEAAEKASATAMRSVFQSALVFFTVTGSIALISDITLISEMCVMLSRGALISAVIILFLLAPTLSICESFIKKTSLDWPYPNPLRVKPTWKTEPKLKHKAEKVPLAASATATATEDQPKKAIPERRYVQPLGTIPSRPQRAQVQQVRPVSPQGMPQRPAQPMPPQGVPQRPMQPIPPQGMPQRPVQPIPPQGMPPRPMQPIPPQGIPRPGVPVRTAQVPPQGRPVMPPPPQGYPYYPPFPGGMPQQPMPQQPNPNMPPQQARPNPQGQPMPQNTGRAPFSPDPFEVNPYANKPYYGKKEDK
ncbi:MAG: antibiotic ABC transporter permease [Ruminococcaceae bacterium]|nr:antibiotic ABC transporter permease [Oscillospiraceae bacterium]